MTKLLEQAVAKARDLSDEKQDAIAEMVLSEIESERRPSPALPPHGIMEIAPVSLGKIIQLPGSDDDLLGEMLEDHP